MATSVSADIWSSVMLSLSARQGKFGQYIKSKYIGISKKIIIIIKLRWALFVTNTIIQSITSSEMCSLHLTHPSAHTPGAVGSPGSSWGFGPLLKGLTSVVDNSCRSRDSNPQPRVTSPTLGHNCPLSIGYQPKWVEKYQQKSNIVHP